VLAFAAVVLLCVLLKRRGLITAEHGPLFARLLTQVALPVVIFSKLAVQPIAPGAPSGRFSIDKPPGLV
jgi:predicted permease